MTPHPGYLPLSEVQGLKDHVFHEVAGFFLDITAIKESRPRREALQLNAALASLPPPSSPSFQTPMAKASDEVKRCVKAAESARNTKVHRCLVRCSRVKQSLFAALRCLILLPSLSKCPSQPGRRTTDLKEVSRIFSDTLLHLGDHPDYLPPDTLVQDLLRHTPQCPQNIINQPLSAITWPQFRKYLCSAKPNKAGGNNTTNAYNFWAPPESVQPFIWKECNLHLSSPIPPK